MPHNKQFITVIPINSFICYCTVVIPHASTPKAIITAFTQSKCYQFILFKSI